MMLNIGRLAAGDGQGKGAGIDYYLETVASGVEDYYLGEGEAPGVWLGSAVPGLGLEGTVAAEQLRAVMARTDPSTGETLGSRRGGVRRPGFDLTFRAPKSVSLLWAVGAPETTREVQAAHDAAVHEALSYLEETAGFSRRGAGGVEAVKGQGFVAAAFRHRASRAGDPLLHTHVLVANLIQAVDDGVWRTLDARRLYAQAKTAGFLYQAQLRHELTARLGVEWTAVENGYADVAGVDEVVIRHFSTRRREILEHMADRGESSAAAAQVATLETRRRKDHQVESRGLFERWRAEAAQVGFTRETVAATLGRAELAEPGRRDLRRLAEQLFGAGGLTRQAASFDRRDVIRALAERLGGDLDAQAIQQLADALLDPELDAVVALEDEEGGPQPVIRREDGQVVAAQPEATRYTTRGMLAAERSALERARQLAAAQGEPADPDVVAGALARRPTITDDQAAMVEELTSGSRLTVVIGKAGAGKTFAIDAAREVWQAQGRPVLGAALAARAASELGDAAGIEACTVDRLLADLESGRGRGLLTGGVLVVDEAGMIGTRTLATLLEHVGRQDASLVLVGDDRQLPEIDAGGLFGGLAADEHTPTVQLTENRRQQHAWERALLDELRHGEQPASVLEDYLEAGRVTVAPDAEALYARMVADWWAATREVGFEEALLVALRRDEVDQLNARARLQLAEAGELAGPAVALTGELHDGRVVQLGDRVVCLQNRRGLRDATGQAVAVTNGTRGRVVDTDPATGSIAVRVDGREGAPVVVPDEYLAAGNLDYGYAVTGHKAQGATVEHTFVLGSQATYREWGYVALSRGRAENRLYVVAGQTPTAGLEEIDVHGLAEDEDALSRLQRRLEHSRRQELATPGVGEGLQVAGENTRRIARRLDQALAEPRATQGLARARRGLDNARQRVQAATTSHARATAAAQVASWEQEIERLEDQLAEQEATRQRQRGWLEAHSEELAAGMQQLAAREQELTRRVAALQADPPDPLTEALGEPPDSPAHRRRWRKAARSLAAYQQGFGLADPERALTERPSELDQRRAWERTREELERAREELEAEQELGPQLAL